MYLLDYTMSRVLSIFFLIVLNFFEQLKGIYRVQTKAFKIKKMILLVLSIASLFEILVTFALQIYQYCWFTAFARIVILIVVVK
jgi:hypothetical protein